MVDETPLKPEEDIQNTSPVEVPQISVSETSDSASSEVEASVSASSEVEANDKMETTKAETSATNDQKTEAKTPSAPSDKQTKGKAKKNRKNKKTKAKYYIPVEVGQQLEGKIKTITDFGAFVNINLAVDGLIHISELARRRVEKVTDVVTENQEVTVWVKSIDKERGRIGLTMLKPIQRRYGEISDDDVLEGEIKRIENYGVFVDIGLEREGLVHISELAHDYVKVPSDVVSIGDIINVKVLKVDAKKKQVNLSIKALVEPPEPEVIAFEEEEEEEEFSFDEDTLPTSMAVAFGMLETGKKLSKKKQAKRRKRDRSMDDVVKRTLAR